MRSLQEIHLVAITDPRKKGHVNHCRERSIWESISGREGASLLRFRTCPCASSSLSQESLKKPLHSILAHNSIPSADKLLLLGPGWAVPGVIACSSPRGVRAGRTWHRIRRGGVMSATPQRNFTRLPGKPTSSWNQLLLNHDQLQVHYDSSQPSYR